MPLCQDICKTTNQERFIEESCPRFRSKYSFYPKDFASWGQHVAALRSDRAVLAAAVAHLCRGDRKKTNPPGSVGAVLGHSQDHLMGCGYCTGWPWPSPSHQCPSFSPCEWWYVSDPGLSLFRDLNWQKTLFFSMVGNYLL